MLNQRNEQPQIAAKTTAYLNITAVYMKIVCVCVCVHMCLCVPIMSQHAPQNLLLPKEKYT